MSYGITINSNKRGLIKIDPRTFLYLILISNLAIFLMPSIIGEMLLMGCIILLSLLCGLKGFTIKFAITYILLLCIDYFSMLYIKNDLLLTIALGCRYIRKVFPCGLLGVTLIRTTSVGEFMASLTKMRTPKSILIPLTVLIRYFPSISEDRRAIKKAMSMRGLSNGFFKHPKMTIECIYVPLLMAGSRRADELSAAAVTRGIENPKPRTSITDVGFRFSDFVCFILGTIIVALCIRGI